MRTLLALAALFAAHALLLAAPVPAGGPPISAAARKQLASEALTYAQQVMSVATQVAAGYVRPVERCELILAAIRGLYEAARLPAPTGVEADLKKRPGDDALVEILVQARIRVGPAEEVQGHRALLASCRAMLRSLDPHSDVVTEEDRRIVPWGDQPACLGLELADNVGVGPLKVARVLPGTPAQRAGIRPGDEVTQIDGKPLRGMTTAQAAGLIKGKAAVLTKVSFNTEAVDSLPPPPPEPVSLWLSRPGCKEWRVKLEFQATRPESVFGVQRRDDNSWEYLADRELGIAHVRLEILNRGTASDLAEVLTRLENAGMRGLILDLRWSPGGFLDEAVGVAGLFLDDGVIATVRKRDREDAKLHNTQLKRFRKVPLVVLVNGQTSGGTELIAAALQDRGRAVVAGQRTLGKASVQEALYVDMPGASIKLTSGEFVRPSDKNLHRRPDSRPSDDWGIRPSADLEFRMSPEMTRELKKQWDRQTLRPGTDGKLLPLDDPDNDPQRQCALDWLRKRLK